MASTNEHLRQAQSNEALAELLAKSPFPDWRCTVLFYASLHYVQAYFSSLDLPKQPTTHGEREKAIKSDPIVNSIRIEYRKLKDWSIKSRYEPQKPRRAVFEEELVPAFNTIKEHLQQYLPEPDAE